MSVIQDFIDSYEIEELQLPEQSASNRTARWYYTEYDWRKWLAVLLPFSVFAFGMVVLIWLILAHLRRQRLMENMREHALQFSTAPVRMGSREQVTKLQPLRQIFQSPLRTIEPESTIKATVAAGGLLVPRFESRDFATDFVALVERAGENDHQAAFANSFLDVLEASGLAVERLHFRRSPDHAIHARSNQAFDLNTLVQSHPNSIFLFFLEETALAEAHSGLPQEWISKLDQVETRFAVLPTQELLGSDGTFARSLGFKAVPCSPNGLNLIAETVSEKVENHLSPATASEKQNAQLLELRRTVDDIVLRADIWTQPSPPGSSDVAATLDKLASVVGNQQLRWIAATAVYPEVRWSITTHLKRLVTRKKREGSSLLDPTLMEISRLPWFRQGFMPTWVRRALLDRLRQRERAGIRARILRALGLIPSDSGANDQLEFNVSESKQKNKKPRRPSDRILLDFLMPRLSRDSTLFNLPDAISRQLIRKPVAIIATAAIFGAAAAGTASYTALSILPINECDLYASSRFDSDRIGPARSADIIRRAGNLGVIKEACQHAIDQYPDRLRHRYSLYYVDIAARGRLATDLDLMLELEAQGYPPAINSIGFAYDKGLGGLPKDENQALSYYVRAFEAGANDSVHNIFEIIEYSDDPTVSNIENYETFRNLAIEREAGFLDNVYDYYRDGHVFADGSEIKPDPEEFFRYVQISAQQQHWHAFERLGQLYDAGNSDLGIKEDDAKAIKYYEQAIATGATGYSASQLARLYRLPDQEDLERATYMTIFSLKLGEEGAFDEFMAMYGDGTLAISEETYSQIAASLSSALQSNRAEQLFDTGKQLYWASQSGSLNEELAVKLIKRAHKLGLEEATTFLYDNGID